MDRKIDYKHKYKKYKYKCNLLSEGGGICDMYGRSNEIYFDLYLIY